MNITKRGLLLAGLAVPVVACTQGALGDSQPSTEVPVPVEQEYAHEGKGKDFFLVELSSGAWMYRVFHEGNNRNYPFQVMVVPSDTGELVLSSHYFTDDSSAETMVLFTIRSDGEYAVKVNAQSNVLWKVEVRKPGQERRGVWRIRARTEVLHDNRLRGIDGAQLR